MSVFENGKFCTGDVSIFEVGRDEEVCEGLGANKPSYRITPNIGERKGSVSNRNSQVDFGKAIPVIVPAAAIKAIAFSSTNASPCSFSHVSFLMPTTFAQTSSPTPNTTPGLLLGLHIVIGPNPEDMEGFRMWRSMV